VGRGEEGASVRGRGDASLLKALPARAA